MNKFFIFYVCCFFRNNYVYLNVEDDDVYYINFYYQFYGDNCGYRYYDGLSVQVLIWYFKKK